LRKQERKTLYPSSEGRRRSHRTRRDNLLLLAGSKKKWISRIRRVPAQKIISRSVPRVGSGFQSDAGHGPRLPSVFRFRILLCAEFLDSVDSKQGRCIAVETYRVDCALASERLHRRD